MNSITFYKSSICPRCALASRTIEETARETNTEVKKVDVLIHPLKALRDGVKWIPAVKIGETLYYQGNLKREKLLNLINENFNSGKILKK